MTMKQLFSISVFRICLTALGLTSFTMSAYAMKVVETMTDRCSVQVVIKVPYPDPDEASEHREIRPTDVILDRTGVMKHLIQPQGPNRGVVLNPSTGKSPWTPMISPVPKNADRYFRWICGTTAERSRCPSGTKGITARLGPDRLFQTRCWK